MEDIYKHTLDSANQEKPSPSTEVTYDLTKITLLEDELKKAQNIKKHIISKDNDKKAILNRVIDSVKIEISQIPYAQKVVDKAVIDIKALIADKEHIINQECPTCMQKWIGNTADDKINGIDSQINNLKQLILDNKAILDGEEQLQIKLNRFCVMVKHIDVELDLHNNDDTISILQKKITEAQSEYKSIKQTIENKYLKTLQTHQDKIHNIKEYYDNKINPEKEKAQKLTSLVNIKQESIRHYKIALESYNSKIKRYSTTLDEKETTLVEKIKNRENLSQTLSIAEETKRLIKTFTLQIFQETLDNIGDYATNILADIPNMSNTSIYFEGCKENKSGTIKDEVNAIINMDGYSDVNIKTLSGGERTAIDLAVDIAVIDMIESISGKGAEFFILDEPFDGLEDINIIQCLEILKQVDTNKKIIIVDHNPIAKEMITDTIIVERDGEESVVL